MSDHPGPRFSPMMALGALGGVALLFWCWHSPSIQIIWQAPLGLWLVVACIGKIAAR